VNVTKRSRTLPTVEYCEKASETNRKLSTLDIRQPLYAYTIRTAKAHNTPASTVGKLWEAPEIGGSVIGRCVGVTTPTVAVDLYF